ncbi:hypothetical protein J3458_009551 [Metarhizium acridum]|uniref:uncharacterized protein n=1 Tax=Metarhizium acridum TaxID=92637 RepID=UPI001C6AE487|nr:hypothetical protein J3458_009551 [Metarhizium acridum]
MGLNILLNTNVTSIKRDGSKYSVELDGPPGRRTISSKHVVLATSVISDKPNTPRFTGQDTFKGVVSHSSQRKSGKLVPDIAAKDRRHFRVQHQRPRRRAGFRQLRCKAGFHGPAAPIFSVSSHSWKTIQLGCWNMDGLTMDEAGVLGNSFPTAMIRTMSIGSTAAMAEADKDMLDGLRKAGLALRTGQDGHGLADHQLIKGGRFYIDQGASRMIIDGRIKVHHCEGGVREFGETSVTLADGTNIETGVVVLSTGYGKNLDHVRKLMGDEVANKLEGLGDLEILSNVGVADCRRSKTSRV